MCITLSTKEIAKLYRKSESTIRCWAESKKINADCILNQFNSPEYVFSIDNLDKPIQEKYFSQVKAGLPKVPKPTSKKDKPFDHYTDDERQEIMWWEKTLKEWKNYRDRYLGDKAEADDKFVALCAKTDPEHVFSVKTLYRKKKQLETQGLEALIDKRGKGRKGKSKITEEMRQTFLSYYLDEAQHPIQKCYEYTRIYFQKTAPELVADIPTYSTFWRMVQNDIPEPMEVLGRQGQKAFRDRCAPYIRRTYEAMASNLNLMLMRSARVQTVGRRGVHLDIAGQRLDYWNDDFLFNYMGKKVYFRYDPDNLSAVRVYDLEDRFIMTVPVDNTAVLKYGDGQEQVKAGIRKVRQLERITKEALEASTVQAFGKRTALELVLEQALDNKTARIIPEATPKILELQRPQEEPLLKAVGGPDLDVMNRNAMKRNVRLNDES